jgi:hypothetical protein
VIGLWKRSRGRSVVRRALQEVGACWYLVVATITTTLSVVPVRFEYACGHTALVSLPRVKAESPGQRNWRVNQEKAAAGQRSCDFCPPVSQPVVGPTDLDGVGGVAATPAVTLSTIDGVDNAPLERAVIDERSRHQEPEEAMATTTTDPATGHDQAQATPATTPPLIRPRGVFPVRKLSDEQEREVARLYAETPTPLGQIGLRFGIAQTSVARIAQRRGAALRSQTISRAMASHTPGPIAAADTDPATESEQKLIRPAPAAQPTVAPTARGPKPATVKRQTAPAAHRPRSEAPAANSAPVPTATRRSRTAGLASSTEHRQFVVTFAAEQILEAESALDALRQAQARGTTEVTSIVRIA